MASHDHHVSGELTVELARHARLLHMMRLRMAAQGPAGLDGATFGLLMALVKGGPTRQGELAERSLLDPSTVSRYVAQLVRAGLVARRPDPADGRAVQLVLTEQGLAVGARVRAQRERFIGHLLADWSPAEAQLLLRLMRRLNDDLESFREPVKGFHDSAEEHTGVTPAPLSAHPTSGA